MIKIAWLLTWVYSLSLWESLLLCGWHHARSVYEYTGSLWNLFMQEECCQSTEGAQNRICILYLWLRYLIETTTGGRVYFGHRPSWQGGLGGTEWFASWQSGIRECWCYSVPLAFSFSLFILSGPQPMRWCQGTYMQRGLSVRVIYGNVLRDTEVLDSVKLTMKINMAGFL